MQGRHSESEGAIVRALGREDLRTADRIFRLAFGTYLNLPDPMTFGGDTDFIQTRWTADPDATLAAEVGGLIVGTNFAARWGSFAFFGPLTVHPSLWDRGIAQRLLAETMELFERWGVRHAGLFTFPQSPRHIGLYEKAGFAARFLTAVTGKTIEGAPPREEWRRFSTLDPAGRLASLADCAALTGSIFDGLSVEREIRAVHDQRLGDTLLLDEGGRLAGLAVCHRGAGSEAGSGTCYVKFAAVAPGSGASGRFDRLLRACEEFASEEKVTKLLAGMNLGRSQAYDRLRARGFRNEMLGVAMERPREGGYNRPEAFVIDDWR